MKNVMKRAWEIKKMYDRKAKTKENKAIFSECLKLAWEEKRQAKRIAEEMEITIEDADKMAEKETEYKMTEYEFGVAVFTWRLWENYGKRRAYYKVSTRSKYANNKKDNFIDLAA